MSNGLAIGKQDVNVFLFPLLLGAEEYTPESGPGSYLVEHLVGENKTSLLLLVSLKIIINRRRSSAKVRSSGRFIDGN